MGLDREHTLKLLHTAATEIQECDSVKAACERTVGAAEEILNFKQCTVLLHDDGWLEPVAMSTGAPSDGARRMAADQGLAGRTFQTGNSYVVDDVTNEESSDPAKTSYRSGISVPIGEAGVFQAVAEERAAFDEADIELAELLVAHTARTINRIRFTRDLQASQAALERQNERLEAFVNTVSHDLRNPLNVATGRLSLAQTECESEHLDGVANAHNRMEVLIEDLLTLAREGRPVETTELVDLAAIVRSCWETVETGNATLELATDRTVTADRNRLKQLFENLLRNAIEHGGETVTVSVGELEDADGFYVADDGPGIPPEDRDAVFERGYSTAADGTGFGLPIVAEIADVHGWKIGIADSEAGGARIEIRDVAAND